MNATLSANNQAEQPASRPANTGKEITVGASAIIREGDFRVRILHDGVTFKYSLPDNRELDRIIAVLEKPDWDELELRAAVLETEEATE